MTRPRRHRRHRRISLRARRLRALGVLVVLAAVVIAGITLARRPGGDRAVGQPRSAGATSPPSTTRTAASPTASPTTSPTATSAGSAAASTSTTGPGAERAQAAVGYARRHGMTSSVAMIDTRTGALTTAGNPLRRYPTASVVKTMIATRVLLNGQMSGQDAQLAYLMITKSDNDAAYALYPQVGGDGLLPWLARHYRIDDLGAKPAHPGLWGSTRITAEGMARFYAAVRADPIVWPWLSNAMRHHQPVTTAGEPNGFGLAALAAPTAVKNGWNVDDDPAHPGTADINTTGFVAAGRYAVVILSQGPGPLYFLGGEKIVTRQAALLFPQ